MKIKIKDYEDFVESLEISIKNNDYYGSIKDGIHEALELEIRNIARIALGNKLETIIREAAREIVFPLIKEKLKEMMTDKVITEIVESIAKEVVDLAKDLEKDFLRVKRFTEE